MVAVELVATFCNIKVNKKSISIENNYDQVEYCQIENMIIYINKGNPHGLKVQICVNAAGVDIPIKDVASEGVLQKLYFSKWNLKENF